MKLVENGKRIGLQVINGFDLLQVENVVKKEIRSNMDCYALRYMASTLLKNALENLADYYGEYLADECNTFSGSELYLADFMGVTVWEYGLIFRSVYLDENDKFVLSAEKVDEFGHGTDEFMDFLIS